jgi:hypothetical protein
LREWAGQFLDPNSVEDDGSEGNIVRPIKLETNENDRYRDRDQDKEGLYVYDGINNPVKNIKETKQAMTKKMMTQRES